MIEIVPGEVSAGRRREFPRGTELPAAAARLRPRRRPTPLPALPTSIPSSPRRFCCAGADAGSGMPKQRVVENGMGLRAMTLGHGDRRVVDAVTGDLARRKFRPPNRPGSAGCRGSDQQDETLGSVARRQHQFDSARVRDSRLSGSTRRPVVSDIRDEGTRRQAVAEVPNALPPVPGRARRARPIVRHIGSACRRRYRTDRRLRDAAAVYRQASGNASVAGPFEGRPRRDRTADLLHRARSGGFAPVNRPRVAAVHERFTEFDGSEAVAEFVTTWDRRRNISSRSALKKGGLGGPWHRTGFSKAAYGTVSQCSQVS
jgi:hypothetical protein